jgi:hypothetical protein
MPKVDGLTPEQRKAQLKDQLADDGAEPIDLPPAPPVVSVAPVAAVAPAVSTDTQALIAALVAALGQNNQATADAIAAAGVAGRNPIPETYLLGGYPGKSVYSHPDGDDKHPRTVFRCPMYMGIRTEKGEIIPAFDIFADTCTEWERVTYNALVPGEYWVERNDGVKALWRVVEQKDDLGVPIRLVVAVPQMWLKTDAQASMPSQKSFLRQLTEAAAVAA